MSVAKCGKVELARMEADMAYFQARLELLGEPNTLNQAAQRRAFVHLYKQLSRRLETDKGTQSKVFSVEGLFDG